MLSKYKIFDNLRRSIIPIITLLIITFSRDYKIITFAIIANIISTILDIISYIVFKKGKDSRFIYAHKSFNPSINSLKASILRAILEICFLPHKAYINLLAIIKTTYRMNVSKNHLLEWLTAEEAEKQSKINLGSYFKFMWINILFGVIYNILCIFTKRIIYLVLGIMWLVGPIIAWYISKDKKQIKPIDIISNNDKEYLLNIGKKTWQYFKDYMNVENNFLPPDNYQEDRIPKVVPRTSTTNIGLGLVAIMSAYDLKYIDLEETIYLINNILNTLTKLEKLNGHLYNWYNTKTLEPLIPKYISTVDNGNFIGYLYTTKQFLIDINNKEEWKHCRGKLCSFQDIFQMIEIIDNIINMTDFSILYNDKKHLFSIGYDVEQNKLTNSYYDLLASEARQASLIAIAKKDIRPKHWNYLSRTLTSLNKYKGLISWSGTAFEYLMPNINIKEYEGSLIDESCRFLIYSQIEYAKKLGIPFRNIRSGI